MQSILIGPNYMSWLYVSFIDKTESVSGPIFPNELSLTLPMTTATVSSSISTSATTTTTPTTASPSSATNNTCRGETVSSDSGTYPRIQEHFLQFSWNIL